MKIQKFNESTDWENFDTSEKLSEIFFEECDNFSGEDEKIEDDFIKMGFNFPLIDIEELEQIWKCKEFIQYFQGFFITSEKYGIKINIWCNESEKLKLDEKLELHKNANNYNI